jgi:(E)-4-hydroxy-3-methylbut-2-enyl-diphosphate synthase
MIRRKTHQVLVGSVGIGSDHPVSIQSMTTTDTRDVEATVSQIQALASAGCEIIRLAVPDMDAAQKLDQIIPRSSIPVVADIHFDYRLAMRAMEAGAAKIRLNPGNIGSADRVREVVMMAKERSIPIRIGVNGGSLEKELLERYGGVTPQGIVESALGHLDILDKLDFKDVIVALKSSDILTTIESYRLLSKETNAPFHIGLTESGTLFKGSIRSSIAIGCLLLEGLGDTLRVSLTGDPLNEVRVAKEILSATGLRTGGIRLISCPTCGRCQIDLARIADEVERRIEGLDKDITLAIMGCAVNGPGEAREADLGIAGGKGEALIFKKGVILKKAREDELVELLIEEIMKL